MRLKPGKFAIKLIIGITILVITIFFAVSPVAKYFIEKNSEAWTGRKITMKSLFINLLNWNVTVKGIRVYESGNKEVFFSADKIHTELSLLQMIKGGYKLKIIKVESPYIIIEQNGDHFNFDDLIQRFTSEDTVKKKPDDSEKPLEYYLEAISVSGGRFIYRDKQVHNEIILQDFIFKCPLLAWNEPEIKTTLGFSLKSGGRILSTFILNSKTMAYTLWTKADAVDLKVLYPYVKDFILTTGAGGALSSNILLGGNFNKPQAIALSGDIGLSDFSGIDIKKQTVASWKSFDVHIDSINIADNRYDFGKISLSEPLILVELYKTGNNISNLMVPAESVASDSASVDSIDYSNPFTMMADYIRAISRDYIISNYTATSVKISNGHIVYNDYTLEDRFTYDLEDLNLQTGRIDSKSDSISFSLSCLANRSGLLNAHLAFDPKDYKNMAINYSVNKMRISDFNPYSRFYVAHAFVEGLLDYESSNTIHNGILASTNVMHIEKIEVSKRIGKGLYSLPVRLAIVILRDRHGNIDLDIPVEGNLNDPTYKLGKVIWKILGNLVVKAATAPFSLLSKAFGADEEELKRIRFDYLQKTFDKQQIKSLDLISKSLKEKPGLKVSMVQVASRENEKEALALFQTKSDYYFENIVHEQKESLSADEIKSITAISNNDSLFNTWLNRKLLPQDVVSVPSQLKCRMLKGEEWLNQQTAILFEQRNRFILNYLVNEKQLDAGSIIISTTMDEKSAQFESTPRYIIEFIVDE
jgi:hypothetical protein